jgi:glycosyltransferase involved in cell wall biosynthesis
MRILYDHQVFSLQNAGGISRYHFELASRLSHYSDVEVDTYLGLNQTVYPFEASWSPRSRTLGWNTRIQPGIPRYALNELLTGARSLFGGKWDIYHPTLYRRMPSVRCRRVVVTHHDCIHEYFPENFDDVQHVLDAKRKLYAAADFIICVSESSRNDLLHFYGVERNRTSVIYHGVTNLVRNTHVSSRFIARLNRPYLLYVGSRVSYKNFGGLLKAYASGGFSEDYDLVVAGGGNFSASEESEIAQLGLTRFVIHSGVVSESELADAYAEARLFVYPSLYEGFGFPPLEAMRLGCPVLAARCSSIPEVCGSAAIYFDPATPGDLEKVMRNALNNSHLPDQVKQGIETASRYSWETCASRTLSLYRSL